MELMSPPPPAAGGGRLVKGHRRIDLPSAALSRRKPKARRGVRRGQARSGACAGTGIVLLPNFSMVQVCVTIECPWPERRPGRRQAVCRFLQ